MERFIGDSFDYYAAFSFNLKSSMERFIEKT